ncbi:uncharacterized protein BdWA1_004099, partial [Babesia duncani]
MVFTASAQFERVFRHLINLFPYGLSVLFQFLHTFLPTSSSAGLKLVIDLLTTSFPIANLSPMTLDVAAGDTKEDFKTVERESLEVQILAMIGMDKQTITSKFLEWEIGNVAPYIPARTVCKLNILDRSSHSLVEAQIRSQFEIRNQMHSDFLKGPCSSRDGMSDVNRVRNVMHDRMWTLEFQLNECLKYNNEIVEFTVIRAIWTVYKGCLAYLQNMSSDLTESALEAFVTCNALLCRLCMEMPNLSNMFSSHIMTRVYATSAWNNDIPFGPCDMITLHMQCLMVALQRPQLRPVLLETLQSLNILLQPSLAMSSSDPGAHAYFYKEWMFMVSLSRLSHDHIFAGLYSIMQEEERLLQTYPVTRAFLQMLKQMLENCPPEMWTIDGRNLGLLNISCTSLEHETDDCINGISTGVLKKFYESIRPSDANSEVQTRFLMDALTHIFKNIGPAIFEFEFANVSERLHVCWLVLEICRLAVGIFKPAALEAQGVNMWHQRLYSLASSILQALSDSNYISHIAKVLIFQLDVVHCSHIPQGSALVMVNPIMYSQISSDFYTYRIWRLGQVLESHNNSKSPIINARKRWRLVDRDGNFIKSEQVMHSALQILKDLFLVAATEKRHPLYNTLAKSLVVLFQMSLPVTEYRRMLVPVDGHVDAIGYFSKSHYEITCTKLPQVSLLQSIMTHGFYNMNAALVTQVVTLFLLQAESWVIKGVEFQNLFIHETINDLSALKGLHDIVAMVHKQTGSFYEYLISAFATADYPLRVATLEYLIACLDTRVGIQMLNISSCTLDLDILAQFFDVVLRIHSCNNQCMGDFVLVHLALVGTSQLVAINYNGDKHLETMRMIFTKLVNVWRAFDTCDYFDSTPDLDYIIWHPRLDYQFQWIDYNAEPKSFLEQRRYALVLVIGSLYAIVDMLVRALSVASPPTEALLTLVKQVATDWDFVDAAFPLIACDPRFIQVLLGEYPQNIKHPCGLWLGENCMEPLSKSLHILDELNISPGDVFKFDVSLEVDKLNVGDEAMLTSLVKQVMGPPESNGTRGHFNLWDQKPPLKPAIKRHMCYFTLCPFEQYGYDYKVCVPKCAFYAQVHAATRGLHMAGLARVRELIQCARLAAMSEALKDVKLSLLCRLCDFSKALAKSQMVPQAFIHMAFNAATLVQQALTHPHIVVEEPLYVRALLEFLGCILVSKSDLLSVFGPFKSYYKIDPLTQEEFELVACNVYGGLVAQLVRYIVDFADVYPLVLKFGAPAQSRRCFN